MSAPTEHDDDTSLVAKRGALAIGLSLVANAVVLAGVRSLELVPRRSHVQLAFGALPDRLRRTRGDRGVLGRRASSSEPRPDVRRVAILVSLLSYLPDLWLLSSDPAITARGAAILMSTHTIVAAICIVVLTGRVP